MQILWGTGDENSIIIQNQSGGLKKVFEPLDFYFNI